VTELLTAAQMRAIEMAAIESGQVAGLDLMERAGRGVVEAIFEVWPELEGGAPAAGGEGGSAPQPAASPRGISGKIKQKVVVLCGPGNNGGDGFVVARLLHERGWVVELYLYGDPKKLRPDARVNYERWVDMGGVQHVRECDSKRIWQADLVVDALLGTGLTRPVDGHLRALIDRAQARDRGEIGVLSGPKFVGVDVPSGLDADSGVGLGRVMRSDLTVSFHRPKLGHFLRFGGQHCGQVVVKDIGLGGGNPSAQTLGEVARLVKAPVGFLSKRPGSHKFANGHALVLSGPSGHTGAARLAARGALRVGAGVVTLGVPAQALQELASQVTAVMTRRIDEGRVLQEVLSDERINALCLGPALGIERVKELLPIALAASRSTVLDADALSAFAGDPDGQFGLLHEDCVLTPHAGEFARLFPDLAEKLNTPPVKGPAYSKVEATREAARRAGCVVLFKGPDTVIAAPDGRCSVNSAAYDRQAPWLATAGSGDVLAGFITGFLARGFAPMQAAEAGAWLHVECALKFGPGLIAEDLPEQLPAVFRDLGV